MIKYKVGYNFDLQLVDFIRKVNEVNENAQIDSVYSSIMWHDKLTARPKYKLANLSICELELHIKALHRIGVSFCYPLNASYIGSKNAISVEKLNIISFVKTLEEIGVDCIIVTHPLIAEIVHNNTSLATSISSIANIFSANQMAFIHENYNSDTFCLSPYFNKKIDTLDALQKCCGRINCNIELIVNELCGLGYNMDSFSPCIYRDTCFDCHSENETKKDVALLGGYPQTKCMANRAKCNSTFWAKTMVIRPEDICHYYNALGISRFKITGRTATTDALCKVIDAYINFSYDGDVADLWYMGENFSTINNKKMEGLINRWFTDRTFSCDKELCGITCSYCDDYLNNS